MKNIAQKLLIIAIILFTSSANAEDTSCKVFDPITGTVKWDGVRCAVDVNGNGSIDDCSELFVCSKPKSGGWCDKSTAPVGYKCISTDMYYLAQGFNAAGVDLSKTKFVTPGTEFDACNNYDPDTQTGCPDQTCSPVWSYTCSKDSSIYASGELCQSNCGGQCSCSPGGFYNDQTKLCEIESTNPCPANIPYDPSLGICAVTIYCPPGSRYDEATNSCITDTSYTCPSGFTYNSSTGKCQALPQCPNGTLYNKQNDKCESVSCPVDYVFNSSAWRCERDTDCGSITLNTATQQCETAIGICTPLDPTDLQTDYVKIFMGVSEENWCGPCTTCVSKPVMTEVTEVPATYICLGQYKINIASNGYKGSGWCNYDHWIVYGKPYACDRTATNYDKDTCDSVCPCPVNYTPDVPNSICTRKACKAGETLDAADKKCWIAPTVWGGGTCPQNYIARNGRCEAPYACTNGTYNPATGKCENLGTAVCQSPYTAQGPVCVYPIYCNPGGTLSGWNPTRDRCEQTGTYYCEAGYTYNQSYGRCISPYICPAGSTWNQYALTCVQAGGQNACDQGYTWNASYQRCIAPYVCPAGSTWNQYALTCVQAGGQNACDQGYTWNASYQRCIAPYVCPEGSTWNQYALTCVQAGGQNACDQGYTWNASYQRCIAPYVCPAGSTWNQYALTCVASATNYGNCSAFGYTFNTSTSRCEKSPECSQSGQFAATRGLCEFNGTTNCPPDFTWNVPYCEKVPTCSDTGTYDTTLNLCRMIPQETCPLGAYACSSGQCTAVVNCNVVPLVVAISGGAYLAIEIKSFAAAADGKNITFTESDNKNYVVSLSGCTASGSATITGARSFSASGRSIKFFDANNVLLGTITVSGCTVSGSSAERVYGPIANGGDTLDFITGAVIFTPDVSTKYECPLDQTFPCTNDAVPTCTSTGSCVQSCSSGYTLGTNICTASATCPAGGVLNTQRDMCQMNYASMISCPPGTVADLTLGICYYPATCPNGGTFDAGRGVCYFSSCPTNFTWCNVSSYCSYHYGWNTYIYAHYGGSGCYANENAPTCPATPNAILTSKDYYQCYESTGGSCQANFKWCDLSSYCNYHYGWNTYIYSHYGGSACYSNENVPACPITPNAILTSKDYYQCYESTGGSCPANYQWCDLSSYCSYHYGWNTYIYSHYGGSACYSSENVPACPATPNAILTSKDYYQCYESTGGSCQANFKWCDLSSYCSYHYGWNTYIYSHYGGSACYGNENVPTCPSAVQPVSKDYYQCYIGTSGCLTGYGYTLDQTNRVCYNPNNPTCPSPGSIDNALDKCSAPPTKIVCPTGYTWSGTGQVCQKNPECPQAISTKDGKVLPTYFDQEHGVCWTCSENFIFNPSTGTCQADPYCPDGTILNPTLDICESVAEIACPSGTRYEPSTGHCISPAACPNPQCPQGCWDKNLNQCNTNAQQPCQFIDTYDPVLKMCTLNGTAECPVDYLFNITTKKCEQPAQCPPTDWICPKDTDPVCKDTSPYGNKNWKEVSQGDYWTFATTVNPMTYSDFQTVTNYHDYAATMAGLDDKGDVWKYYGQGPFWIKDAILYQDVYLNIVDCTYQDFINSTPPRKWRPRNFAVNKTCSNPNLSWERYEESCLCKKIKEETYTRSCSGVTFTETLTNTKLTPSDMSTCTNDPVPTCTAGLQQQGLNKCDVHQEDFSGSIVCGTNAYSKTRVLTTCADSTQAIIPVEYRSVSSLRGIVKWHGIKCTPCLTSDQATEDDTPSGPEEPIDQTKQCTNFKVFSGHDKRCTPTALATLFTNCCNLSGWFKSWCSNEERELKKRRIGGTCSEVGDYCAKRIFGICIKKKKTYCCFNSKLGRIINEQGRPQIGKSFGSAKNPDCEGFTPEEMSKLDFSRLDLSEYVNDMQSEIDPGSGQLKAVEGMQNWFNNQNGNSQNRTFSPGSSSTGY